MGTANQISFTLRAKVNQREVTPATIGLSLFNQFNSEVEAFLAGGQRRVPLDEVRLEIHDGSYKLLLILPALLAATLEPDLRKLHHEDALGDIDPKRAEVVKQWQKRARTSSDYYVAIDSSEKTFKPIKISRETDYRTPDEDDWVAVEKYAVGTVVDMGGTTAANVHLVNDDTGKRLVALSSEDFLREQKENYLYRKVQVHVSAQENVKTGELRDIRLIAFVGKGPSYDEAELEAAIAKGTKAWAKVPDSVAWLNDMRGSGDE
ncbi:MAG: hypothetical protein ACLPYZ_07530 [Limisphaerales bacterium]